jgi:hypothetical protein
VIEQAREEHPEISIERLCFLMGVSRSWYYERPCAEQKARKDVELRDAIERLVLEFPGYGYRRVRPWHSGAKGGAQTTSECCASCARNRFCAR